VARGIRQFLDIGSGIPTVGNVHETAQSVTPNARVVYLDIDPIAVAHSEALLAGDPHTRVFQADLARPDQLLGVYLMIGVSGVVDQ
jgi:16S rRNA G1207 methylase RsmC